MGSDTGDDVLHVEYKEVCCCLTSDTSLATASSGIHSWTDPTWVVGHWSSCCFERYILSDMRGPATKPSCAGSEEIQTPAAVFMSEAGTERQPLTLSGSCDCGVRWPDSSSGMDRRDESRHGKQITFKSDYNIPSQVFEKYTPETVSFLFLLRRFCGPGSAATLKPAPTWRKV
jgi:hypothetical protein